MKVEVCFIYKIRKENNAQSEPSKVSFTLLLADRLPTCLILPRVREVIERNKIPLELGIKEKVDYYIESVNFVLN